MFFNKIEKEKPICLKILKSQEKSIIRGWDNKSSNVKKTLKALGQCMA